MSSSTRLRSHYRHSVRRSLGSFRTLKADATANGALTCPANHPASHMVSEMDQLYAAEAFLPPTKEQRLHLHVQRVGFMGYCGVELYTLSPDGNKMTVATLTWKLQETRSVITFQQLAVIPAWRRLGIAEKLVRAICAVHPGWRTEVVGVSDEPVAKAFWDRMQERDVIDAVA